MKAVVTFLLAVVLLASCTTEFRCPSYGGLNKTTNHGKKAQSKYARHNRIKSLF